MSGRKLARRACDGCKIRKIRCDEKSPCSSCTTSSIPCTWLKQAQPRGPRKLRDSTLQEIRRTQQLLQRQPTPSTKHRGSQSVQDSFSSEPDPPPEPSSEIANLVLRLCMYRLQLYPLWPVIKIERLIASLQSPNPDVEVFAMAYALAAATLAQLKSDQTTEADRTMAATMEARCQTAKSQCPQSRPPNVTTVRIAFFLHIYHENQDPGGMKSMLYLREAIALAQMISLHRESYYKDVRPHEKQLRRRILWLLYVAEREASILHKQPVTLKTKIELPSTEDSDEADVLAGFQMIVSLLKTADDAGLFETLEQTEYGAILTSNIEFLQSLVQLQHRLADDGCAGADIQNAQGLNLAVNHQWLRVILWRLNREHGAISEAVETSMNLNWKISPYCAAADLVNALSGVSSSAVQIHGPDMRLKIFEIARALIDFDNNLSERNSEKQYSDEMFKHLLGQLYRHILLEPKLAISLHFEALRLADQSIAVMLEQQRTNQSDQKSTPRSRQEDMYGSPYAGSPTSNDSGNYLWRDQADLNEPAFNDVSFDPGDWSFPMDSEVSHTHVPGSTDPVPDFFMPDDF